MLFIYFSISVPHPSVSVPFSQVKTTGPLAAYTSSSRVETVKKRKQVTMLLFSI